MKRSTIIFLFLFVVLLIFHTILFASDCEHPFVDNDNLSLNGLGYVAVRYLGFPSEAFVLCRPPHPPIWNQVRDAGLHFGTTDSRETNRGLHVGELHFYCELCKESATITLYVYQKVALLRDPQKCFMSITWKQSEISPDTTTESIVNTTNKLLESFLEQYIQANNN
ncbi:MAG: hypothetical protein JW866_02440 [Ignavibacteriales bacterium]|nr:hypothetical protein [Ignavibacteriales bacterium]